MGAPGSRGADTADRHVERGRGGGMLNLTSWVRTQMAVRASTSAVSKWRWRRSSPTSCMCGKRAAVATSAAPGIRMRGRARGHGPGRRGGPSTCRHPHRPPSGRCGRAAQCPPLCAGVPSQRSGQRVLRDAARRVDVQHPAEQFVRPSTIWAAPTGRPSVTSSGAAARWLHRGRTGPRRRVRARCRSNRRFRRRRRMGEPGAPRGASVVQDLAAQVGDRTPRRSRASRSGSSHEFRLAPPTVAEVHRLTTCSTRAATPPGRSTSQIFQERIRSATSGTRRRVSRIFRTRSDRAP